MSFTIQCSFGGPNALASSDKNAPSHDAAHRLGLGLKVRAPHHGPHDEVRHNGGVAAWSAPSPRGGDNPAGAAAANHDAAGSDMASVTAAARHLSIGGTDRGAIPSVAARSTAHCRSAYDLPPPE